MFRGRSEVRLHLECVERWTELRMKEGNKRAMYCDADKLAETTNSLQGCGRTPFIFKIQIWTLLKTKRNHNN